ncbi:hypothetical protein NDU88_006325 [Pleurodeles waltl]|uniref:Uncharacterized protein n=1 Tax=Pleurodeles waltl TaxID=8319 RepID=A0AAV7WXA3_PLEWA|nr:hypothetical protein NDU88_006325 [Pleurodeles waltl]
MSSSRSWHYTCNSDGLWAIPNGPSSSESSCSKRCVGTNADTLLGDVTSGESKSDFLCLLTLDGIADGDSTDGESLADEEADDSSTIVDGLTRSIVDVGEAMGILIVDEVTANAVDEDAIDMNIIEEEAAVETVDIVVVNNKAVNTPFDAAIDDAVVIADFSEGFLKTCFTTGGGVGGSEKALLLRSEETEPSLECLLDETELLCGELEGLPALEDTCLVFL